MAERYFKADIPDDLEMGESSKTIGKKSDNLYKDGKLTGRVEWEELSEDDLRDRYGSCEAETEHVFVSQISEKHPVAQAAGDFFGGLLNRLYEDNKEAVDTLVQSAAHSVAAKAKNKALEVKGKVSDRVASSRAKQADKKERKAARKAEKKERKAVKEAAKKERKRRGQSKELAAQNKTWQKKGESTPMLAEISSAYEGYRMDMDSKEAQEKLLRIVALAMELSVGIDELEHANIVDADRAGMIEHLSKPELISAVNQVLEAGSLEFDPATFANMQAILGRSFYIDGRYLPIETKEMRKRLSGAHRQLSSPEDDDGKIDIVA